MTTAQVGYEPVYRWVKNILGRMHTTVVATVAWAVLALLVAQRTTPAALARALPAEHAGIRPRPADRLAPAEVARHVDVIGQLGHASRRAAGAP